MKRFSTVFSYLVFGVFISLGYSEFQCPHPSYSGGLCTIDNKIYTLDGYEFKIFGFNRGQFEGNFPNPYGQWIMDPTDPEGGVFEAGFDSMAAWQPNVIRFPLNQVWWVEDAPGESYQGTYRQQVRQVVEGFRARNIRVILDLHRHDNNGTLSDAANQVYMADTNSKEFWRTLATEFKNDSMVIFELFNEPKSEVGWDVWLNGGTVQNIQYTGMQELYDIVRATGAHNFILIGGLDWAYTLDGVTCIESGATCETREIQGYNLGYVTHIYPQYSSKRAVTSWHEAEAGDDPYYSWKKAWLYLAEDYPIVVTEFGPESETPEHLAEAAQIIEMANTEISGWTAWGWWWYKNHALIQQTGSANMKNNPAAPTEWGQLVRDSLEAMNARVKAGERQKAPDMYFEASDSDSTLVHKDSLEETNVHAFQVKHDQQIEIQFFDLTGNSIEQTDLPLQRAGIFLQRVEYQSGKVEWRKVQNLH